MPIDLGTGVAIFGACGTLTAAIIRFAPARRTNGSMTKEHCGEAHNLLVNKETCTVRHEGLADWMKTLAEEQRVIRNEIQDLTKAILEGREKA